MIRRLLPGEQQLWRSLAREAIEKQPECFVTTVEEEAAIPLSWFADQISQRHVLVAGENEGLAVLCVENQVGFVTSVYVRSSARRIGFASELLAIIRQVAEKELCNSLEVQVFEDNFAAISLYEKQGFRLVQRTPFGTRTDCRLALELSGD